MAFLFASNGLAVSAAGTVADPRSRTPMSVGQAVALAEFSRVDAALGTGLPIPVYGAITPAPMMAATICERASAEPNRPIAIDALPSNTRPR